MLPRTLAVLVASAIATAGCAGGSSPSAERPSAKEAAAAPSAKTPVRVVAEVLELSAEGETNEWFGDVRFLADGTLLVGGTVPAKAPWLDTRTRPVDARGFVVAFDATLAPRWSHFVPDRVVQIVDIGGGRLVAASHASGKDMTLTFLTAGGARISEMSLSTIAGAPCEYVSSDFLRPDGRGGLLVRAACRYGGAAATRYHLRLDAQLRLVGRELDAGSMALDGATWVYQGDDAAMRVRRTAPGVQVWNAEFAKPEAGGRLLQTWPRELPSPTGGMFFAGTAIETMREASGRELPRVRARSFVTSFWPGGRWDRPIFDPMITDDPPEVVGAGLATDSTLLVALRYTHDTQIEGQPLPSWMSPLTTPLTEAVARIAVLELDATTGGARAIDLLVPSAKATSLPSDSQVRAVRASSTHLALGRGRRVFVYPRAPVLPPLAPPSSNSALAQARFVAPSPLPPPTTVAFASTAPPVLAAAWEEVCGPRVMATKNAPCRLEAIAIGPDGTVAVAGGYYGANQIGARPLPRQAFQTGMIAVYEPTGRLRWVKSLGTSWHNGLSDVRVLDDGRVLAMGVHGQAFDAGGKRLPNRTLPPQPANQAVPDDLGFNAHTPYLALYGRDGKLEAAEDIDVLVYGDRNPSHERVCGGELAIPAATVPFAMIARCADSAHRLTLRGLDVVTREAAPRIRGPGYGWSFQERVDPRGRRWTTYRNDGASSLRAVTHREPEGLRSSLLFEPAWTPRFNVASSAIVPLGSGGAFVSVMGEESLLPPPGAKSGASFARLLLARVNDDATPAWSRVLGMSTTSLADQPKLEAIAADEQGRPVVIVKLSAPMEIAGRAFSPGHVLLRLTPDGARADFAATLEGRPGGCIAAANGNVLALAVRGGRAVVLLHFGATAQCNVKDEPTSVLSFALPG